MMNLLHRYYIIIIYTEQLKVHEKKEQIPFPSGLKSRQK